MPDHGLLFPFRDPFTPARRWDVRGWKVRACRAHPRRPWQPRLQRHGTILARAGSFRWLTVYVTWSRYR